MAKGTGDGPATATATTNAATSRRTANCVCVRCGENNNNMIVKENVENEMDFVSRNGEKFSENAS